MRDKKYLILHGHFYQPPRENPWTGVIDRQISAYPFSDWNVRIEQECYTACTRSSVFEDDQILATINCYEYLSFNFGPTLLEWIEKQGSKSLITSLVEADKISRIKNSGHGNAIAQVYNHIIMPLASEKDQYTQIIWGLKDFKKYFKRHSEGLWLSETAINNETASILVDNGVKFVILSPYQANKIIKSNQEIDVRGGKVNTSRPYKLHTKNGSLAVFFYDGYLASQISFGNILSSAGTLKQSLVDAFRYQENSVKLVNIATDGEVYGHHKPFANMSLARLIYENTSKNNSEFEFTNYGKFLADYPPIDECELYLGDEGKGSSWSCAHGVGRWEKNCGCHTGGQDHWNQEWRVALRQAFDYLRDCIYDVALKYTESRLKNLWNARNDFFDIKNSNNRHEIESFIAKHQQYTLTTDESKNIIKLLQSLHYSMLMYTSCGWFFSEISGIETIQDLIYSQIAYEYAKEFLSPDIYAKYLEILSKSQSNISGDGKHIFEKSVKISEVTLQQLKEYALWSVMRDLEVNHLRLGNLSYESLLIDEEKNRYLLYFEDYMGTNTYVAFCLQVNDQHVDMHRIYWRESEEPFSTEELNDQRFWDSFHTWNLSVLSEMPMPLKVIFVIHSMQYEMDQLYCKYSHKKYFIQ
ncbi:MAG: DUF3536 domain-containing protein, partial [Brevinema sp.]